MDRHSKVHQTDKSYKCPFSDTGCTYTSDHKSHMELHIKVHSKEKVRLLCVCERERKAASWSIYYFYIHMILELQPFRCDREGCGYAASRKTHLTIHQRIHENDLEKARPFKCTHDGELLACAYTTLCDIHSCTYAHNTNRLWLSYSSKVTFGPTLHGPHSREEGWSSRSSYEHHNKHKSRNLQQRL